WRASLKWQRLKPYEKFADDRSSLGRSRRPTASRTTKSRLASPKGLTTGSGHPTKCLRNAMKSTFASKSSPACCRCCEPAFVWARNPPTRLHEVSLLIVSGLVLIRELLIASVGGRA